MTQSAHSRVCAAIILVPIGAVAAGFAAGNSSYSWTAAAIAASSGLAGLSNSWFAVGLGRPALLGIYDLVPKLIATAIGTLLVLWTADIVVFAIPTAALPVGSFCLMVSRFGREYSKFDVKSVRRSMVAQAPIVTTNMIGAFYASAPVVVSAALLTPDQAAGVVSGDKIFRMALFSVVALGNSLQSWVLESEHSTYYRMTYAIRMHLVLGVTGGVLIGALSPSVSGVAFGSAAASPFGVGLAYGVSFCCTCVATPFIRNALVVVGLNWIPLSGTAIAAVCGFAAMAASAQSLGAVGITWSYAFSELLAALVIVGAWFALRHRFPTYRRRACPGSSVSDSGG